MTTTNDNERKFLILWLTKWFIARGIDAAMAGLAAVRLVCGG